MKTLSSTLLSYVVLSPEFYTCTVVVVLTADIAGSQDCVTRSNELVTSR